MKRKLLKIVFTLAILFSLIMFINGPIISGTGTITALEGKVQLQVESSFLGFVPVKHWVDLKMDQELNEGDVIRTGQDGKLELIIYNNVYIKVDSNSQVVIGEKEILSDGKKSSIFLKTGRVWTRVKKIYQELTRFEVITPTAVAGVKGTLFSVYTDGKETVLSVREGAVELSSTETHQKEMVTQNRMGTVADGKIKVDNKFSESENNKWKNKDAEQWIEKTKKENNQNNGNKGNNKGTNNVNKGKDNNNGNNDQNNNTNNGQENANEHSDTNNGNINGNNNNNTNNNENGDNANQENNSSENSAKENDGNNNGNDITDNQNDNRDNHSNENSGDQPEGPSNTQGDNPGKNPGKNPDNPSGTNED